MIDLSNIGKPKSDQLNADDIINNPITINIRNVKVMQGGDQELFIYYEGDNDKPYKPCKSMIKLLKAIWGVDGSKYIGRFLTLYCDVEVIFGKEKVGGIRISHASDLSNKMVIPLLVRRGQKKPYVVQPLNIKSVNSDALLSAGESAAKKGMKNYQSWFVALSNDEKKIIVDSRHEEFKKIANGVDNGQSGQDSDVHSATDEASGDLVGVAESMEREST